VPKLKALYYHHQRFYEATEKARFERAHDYYNGRFYSSSDRDLRYRDETNIASHALSSKNLVYAIVDTALSLLIGNTIGVAMNPRNQFAESKRSEVEAYLDYVFSVNKMRRRSTTALLDAVLYGRGIFKTRWDQREDVAKTKTIHPSRLFFDMEQRDADDISYWMETTVISTKEFHRRVKSGAYEGKRIGDVSPADYPKWLDKPSDSYEDMRKAFRWVTVVEYYDAYEGRVCHWIPQTDEIVFKGDVPFSPYSMFALSPNGRDSRGLSEVQLILDDQEALNAMKSLLNEIAYLAIPKFAFDDANLDANSAQRLADAPLGSWTPIGRGESETPGGGATVKMEDLFSRIPTPESPEPVLRAIERAQDDAAFVTAFADQARGQVQNVRTATEMAFVEVQLQTRTSNRRAMFFEAVEDVAAKSLAYAKKYMKSPVEVKMAGEGGWVEVDRWLTDVEAEWQTLAYNPLRDNPAVLGERVLQIMDVLANSENVDKRAVEEFLLDSLHLPSYLLLPKEEVEEQKAAAAEQQAAAAPAAPGPGDIDPEMAGALVQMGAEAGPEGLAELEALGAADAGMPIA